MHYSKLTGLCYSRSLVAILAMWFCLCLAFQSEACSPQQDDSPGEQLHNAAVTDVRMLIEREQSWVGRPRADQCVPWVIYATGWESYESGNVCEELNWWFKNIEELQEMPKEEAKEDLIYGGIALLYQWSARLGHASRAIRVACMEFLYTQKTMKDYWKEHVDNADEPLTSAEIEDMRARLANQEQQALLVLILTRDEILNDLQKAKSDIVDNMRNWIVAGNNENLYNASIIFNLAIFDNEVNDPFNMLISNLVRFEYYEPREGDFAAWGDTVRIEEPDDPSEKKGVYFSVMSARSIEPVDPFSPTFPDHFSVVSDKRKYNDGETITISVTGPRIFEDSGLLVDKLVIVPASDEIHPYPLSPKSIAASPRGMPEDEANRPVEINEDYGPHEIEYPIFDAALQADDDDWTEWIMPGYEPLETDPARLRLRWLNGESPTFEFDDLPKGDYEARVFQLGKGETGEPTHSLLARCRFAIVGENEPIAYPDYVNNPIPTGPYIELWGNGIPSASTNDWSKLIPKSAIDEHKLNGRWIIMAVFGQRLFGIESKTPQLSWAPADRHLDYKLLHSGTFSMEKANGFEDTEWSVFWSALYDQFEFQKSMRKPVRRIDNADFYIVGVRIGANAWGGPYEFKIGDMPIKWTLPEATNIATTRFVRKISSDDIFNEEDKEFVKIDAIFKHGTFFVEIETSAEVETSNRISFELMRSRDGGDLEVMKYSDDHSTYEAYRTPINPRLFRSPLFFVNHPDGKNGWRNRKGVREAGIALGEKDRLIVRVVPHGVVRQGEMGLVHLYTTPAQVGAAWREAVMQAAAIAKIEPPVGWDQLTQEQFNAVVSKDWKTVDSSPFVRVGGRSIQLKVGDLAAMLLIRQKFIESMEPVLPEVRALWVLANGSPNNCERVRYRLKEDALREGSPIGEIPVPEYSIPLATVPYRLIYDEEWLELAFRQTFSPKTRIDWINESTVSAVNQYYEAAKGAHKHAIELDLTDAEDVLKLTAIGMRPMAELIKPHLLRLVEDRDSLTSGGTGFRWEVDPVARGYIGTIQALGQEFLDNEALMDEYNAMTALVVAATGFVLPEALAARAISTALSAGSMAATLTQELPEYLSRSADVKFALGAYNAIGSQRYITASMRAKPGWQIALELVGGSIDLAANVAQLSRASRVWYAFRKDAEIAEIFDSEVRTFVSIPQDEQVAAITRLAQLDTLSAAGTQLSELETNILSRGMKMIDELETLQSTLPPRYVKPQTIGQAETIIMRNGQLELIAPVEIIQLPEGVQVADVMADTADWHLTDVLTLIDDKDALFFIPQHEPWAQFNIGKRVGRGSFMGVYALTDEGNSVLKITRNLETGKIDIARMEHCADMIDGVIPQLMIEESGNIGKVGFIKQEIMPEGSYLLKKVVGDIAGDPLPKKLAKKFNSRRVIGVKQPDGTLGKMTQEQTHAVCNLYKKLIDNNIIWFDGHYGNMVFIEENGELIVKVLDQDFFWKFDSNFMEGPVGTSQGGVLQSLYDFDHDYYKLRLQSMAGHHSPWQVHNLINDGVHAYPDAEFFMYKMMERWGFINYVRGQGWVDGAMELKHVKEILGNIDDARFVDPDLGALLRETGVLPPRGNIPGGGGFVQFLRKQPSEFNVAVAHKAA